MFEELLSSQETTRSILIIDDFKNEATALLFTIVNQLSEKNTIHLYPCFSRTKFYFQRYFQSKPNVHINDQLVESLLRNKSDNFLPSILNEIEKKSFLVFDNVNLILRHFNNNPFKLISFIVESNRRSRDTILMVLHKDSLDDSLINQFKSIFQTVIYSKSMSLNTNEANFKYQIEIDNRNFKSAKTTIYNETIYVTRDFQVKSVEKPNILIKTNDQGLKETSVNEQFKGLTFNVHTNSNDLETKNQLILPYELIGSKTSQPKAAADIKEKTTVEESKIYYAPDEADDFDDDDPDEDLNF